MASSVDFFCSFTQYRVLSLNVQLLFLARKHSLSPYWLIAILLFSKTGGGGPGFTNRIIKPICWCQLTEFANNWLTNGSAT